MADSKATPQKSDLGLRPVDPVEAYRETNPLWTYLGRQQYIPEARATFEALVPDRYKVK